MMRNKLPVAATELPQLLSQDTSMFAEVTAQVAVRLCAALKLTEQVKLLVSRGGYIPHS